MTATGITYDSAQRRRPLAALRHLWEYRSLLRLLIGRELTLRYKRSVLGVWWTLLNPLFTVGVFWLIFSQVFRLGGEGAPFIVYLTAGVLLSGFFSQGLSAAGSAIVSGRDVLAKVHLPPEVFSVAAAVAAAVNFAISLIPLVIIQLIQGVGIPWIFPLTTISVLAMLLFVAGLGLVVASLAVRFYDVLDFVGVLTLLVMYLSAVFYPISIIPGRWQWVIQANPVFHHIEVFRSFAYGGPFSWVSLLVAVGSGILAFALGTWVFSRNWREVVVAL